jgi:hypothetical protein
LHRLAKTTSQLLTTCPPSSIATKLRTQVHQVSRSST